MNAINLTFRTDTLTNWNIAESLGKGKLSKGEVGIAIVETTDGIVEAIARIGINSELTFFSSCPVIFRSPFNFTEETSQIVKLNQTPNNDSFVTYQFDTDGNGKFSSKSFDDVISEFQIPENIISFDTSNISESGYLKWIISSNEEEGEWILDPGTISVQVPDVLYGGNAESF